jgi:CPA2 family monovalent cation:H+ antiporter-2
VLIYGYPVRVALSVGAGLAQIGEFSFILATVGVSLALLPAEGFQLIVAGALLSIALTPFLFRLVDPLEARLVDSRAMGRWLRIRAADLATLPGASSPGAGAHRGEPDGRPLRLHAILCGYGRVGAMVGRALERRGFTFVVISQQRHEIEQLRARGIAALYGEASNVELLRQAQIETARLVIVAGADAHTTHLIVDRARVLNPAADFVVRTGSDEEIAQLRSLSPRVQAVHAQRELAVQMARYSLRRFGVNAAEAEAVAQGLRGRPFAPPPAPRKPSPFDRVRARVVRRGGRADAAEVAEPTGSDPGTDPA